MTGDVKMWSNKPTTPETQKISDDLWWAKVLRICEQRGFAAPWFTADRDAWLELKRLGMTPADAVQENYADLF